MSLLTSACDRVVAFGKSGLLAFDFGRQGTYGDGSIFRDFLLKANPNELAKSEAIRNAGGLTIASGSFLA